MKEGRGLRGGRSAGESKTTQTQRLRQAGRTGRTSPLGSSEQRQTDMGEERGR